MKLTCKTLFPFFFLLLAACSGGQKDISVEDASTWMKELDDSLPLCKISIPGSHDSGACRNGGVFIKTQDIDIATQLKEGIRFFDIRLQAMPDGKLGIYHGPFFQDIYWEENVLADFISFLQANPSETLIVSLKKENGELTDYAKLVSSVLSKPEYQSYFVDNFRQELQHISKNRIFMITDTRYPHRVLHIPATSDIGIVHSLLQDRRHCCVKRPRCIKNL